MDKNSNTVCQEFYSKKFRKHKKCEMSVSQLSLTQSYFIMKQELCCTQVLQEFGYIPADDFFQVVGHSR